MPAESKPDTTASRTDGLVAGAIAALVLLTVAIGALAPGAPAHRAVASGPSGDATCAEWGDGCQVCQRLADGPACSTPGIACVATEPRCLRRTGG